MKLAFSGKGHYTDFTKGFELYKKHAKKDDTVDYDTYKRIVRRYCEMLSDSLCNYGFIDLPENLGMVSVATITRKPQYRGKKFIGYGKIDWINKRYDGQLKTFGIVYLPKHGKNNNLRSFGFVANRRLFKRVKELYNKNSSRFSLLEFNDNMI